MNKLEELKAAALAKLDAAWDDAKDAFEAAYGAADSYEAADAVGATYADVTYAAWVAYKAELKKIQEENSND
jgi:hypothetical protein